MPLYFSNPYLALFFFAVIFIVFLAVILKRFDFVFLLLLFILGSVFLGFRGDGAPDFYQYYNRFLIANNGQDYFDWSIGVFYLYKMIGFFGLDKNTYIIGTGLFYLGLFVVNVFLFITPGYRSLAFSIILLNWSNFDLATNAFRQGVAVSLLLMSIYFLIFRGRYYVFFILSFVSIIFHWAAVVPVIIVFLSNFFKKPSLHSLIIFTAVFFVLSIISPLGFIDLITKLFDIVGLANADNLSHSLKYIESNIDGALFYDFEIAKRLYYIVDVLLPFVFIFFIFFMGGIRLTREVSLLIRVSCFLIIYFLMLIEMVWFFRNMYWVSVLLIITLVNYLSVYTGKTSSLNSLVIKFIMISYVFIYSSLTLWRTTLVKLQYVY